MNRYFVALAASCLLHPLANAQDAHPAMDAKWWVTGGSYLAKRNFQASATGTIAGSSREFDFENALGLDDSPDLFMAELGWQFSENWGVAVQYFRSKRNGSRTLDESFEWQDELYDIGVQIDAGTKMEITRFFFARRFRDNGPHSVKVGAGIHWIDLSAYISGDATLNDQTTEFRTSTARASLPVPNIGIWYRYSPNQNWMASVRTDWLSASIDDYSGDIWNASVGVNFRLWDHIGIGANYQYFELTGTLKEDDWRGRVATSFTGPYLFISGYW